MKKKNFMKIAVVVSSIVLIFSVFMLATNAGSYHGNRLKSLFSGYHDDSYGENSYEEKNENPIKINEPEDGNGSVEPTGDESMDEAENDTKDESENDTKDESENESEPKDEPEDESSDSTGSASHHTNSDGTIVVESGTFDGGGKSFGGVGDGSQSESQPPVFELEVGANLINCVIEPPAGDGIHVHGDNKISNIEFTDVGEDAISMRSSFEGGEVTISDSSFSSAEDKVFQVNRESTWKLNNITVNGAGKVLRQNGGTTFPLTVHINGLNAKDVKESIVRSDSSDCKVYYSNITCNLDESDWWYGDLTAVAN